MDPELVEAMCTALEHRGPDSRGIHSSEQCGLGIQRLRVVDLVTGDQPVYNEDRTIAVVLNGEIYNYRELRSQLQAAGHTFRTDGDTEAIVHLYEEAGPACVRSLHGMFALAVWDSRRGRLLLARDRVGKKPLFYSLRDGALSFASELAALLEDPEVPREIDHQAIDCFLSYQYVPAPFSAFRAVRKLPPASTLLYSEGIARTERYWRLDYGKKRRFDSPAEVHEEVRETVRRAVRRRLVADVPLGAFLSGGVDSAAVVAAMAEASPDPVKTFSIGFDSDGYNELPLARVTARAFGTEHHELVVTPDAVELIPRIVRHYGEPFADSSAMPSFYLAEMARRHVTVALNGDGGDESFGGYQRYATQAALARADRVPAVLRRAVAALGARIPGSGDERDMRGFARRVAVGLALLPPERYANQVAYFNRDQRERLYTPEYRALVGGSPADAVLGDPWSAASGDALVDIMLEVDVETYLPGDLLVKMDIATMAHSLEARSPLLDHELMELAAAIPADLKVRGRQKKVAFRAALRGWVPDQVLDGPKRGFEVPVGKWFREDLRTHVEDVLLDPATLARGYFRPEYVFQVLDRHVRGAEDNSRRIWGLLMLELWHREFIDSGQASARVDRGATVGRAA